MSPVGKLLLVGILALAVTAGSAQALPSIPTIILPTPPSWTMECVALVDGSLKGPQGDLNSLAPLLVLGVVHQRDGLQSVLLWMGTENTLRGLPAELNSLSPSLLNGVNWSSQNLTLIGVGILAGSAESSKNIGPALGPALNASVLLTLGAFNEVFPWAWSYTNDTLVTPLRLYYDSHVRGSNLGILLIPQTFMGFSQGYMAGAASVTDPPEGSFNTGLQRLKDSADLASSGLLGSIDPDVLGPNLDGAMVNLVNPVNGFMLYLDGVIEDGGDLSVAEGQVYLTGMTSSATQDAMAMAGILQNGAGRSAGMAPGFGDQLLACTPVA